MGWRPFFQQQLGLEEWDDPVVRVIAQHRDRLELWGEEREVGLALHPDMPAITVGDWLLLTAEGRFGDCQHESEPGCAVQDAIARGALEARRLASFQKLKQEQAFNSATLAEKRAKDRNFGKLIKAHLSEKKGRKY